jgi:hypothetical protein
MSDFSKAYINMKGVTFNVFHPNITIKFRSNDVIVSKMYAQVDVPSYVSNVRQICVTLYNANSTQLTYPNGTIVHQLKSSENEPIIQGWFEGVKSMRVQLCNTTDGKPPQRFRFAVVGCYTSRPTYILQIPPEHPPQLPVTTTAGIFQFIEKLFFFLYRIKENFNLFKVFEKNDQNSFFIILLSADYYCKYSRIDPHQIHSQSEFYRFYCKCQSEQRRKS